MGFVTNIIYATMLRKINYIIAAGVFIILFMLMLSLPSIQVSVAEDALNWVRAERDSDRMCLIELRQQQMRGLQGIQIYDVALTRTYVLNATWTIVGFCVFVVTLVNGDDLDLDFGIRD